MAPSQWGMRFGTLAVSQSGARYRHQRNGSGSMTVRRCVCVLVSVCVCLRVCVCVTVYVCLYAYAPLCGAWMQTFDSTRPSRESCGCALALPFNAARTNTSVRRLRPERPSQGLGAEIARTGHQERRRQTVRHDRVAIHKL